MENTDYDLVHRAEDASGQRYLYYGGTLAQPLSPDGLHTSGPAVQIGHWDRYEGTYVVRHDVNGHPYYYNFSSAANCCLGPNTGYSVEVNRATSPTSTFVDQNGYPMLYPGSTPALTALGNDPAADNRGHQGGGYPTLKQNGNIWHGVGHNALITDLSGHTWIVYHGVDQRNGWLTGGPNFPITFRQVLLDRIDWTADGWPVLNGGTGPSESNTAPVTTPIFGDNFNTGSACAAPDPAGPFSSTWQTVVGNWTEVSPTTCPTTAGGYAQDTTTSGASLMVSRASVPAGVRTECDLRSASGSAGDFGCVTAYQGGNGRSAAGRGVVAFIDPSTHTLAAGALQNGRTIMHLQSVPLPATFDPTDWHHLSLDEVLSRAGRPTYHVTLTNIDRDQVATLNVTVPANFATQTGSVGFFTENSQASFDNATTALWSDGTVSAPPTPLAGGLLPRYSDDFTTPSLRPQWSVIRPDPSLYSTGNGQLSITVNGDLYHQYNYAKDLVVENPPSGNYMVETKITFDPRDNYQQAGLLVYSDDDHYIKVGPAHTDSLNKMISGKESLEPAPPSDPGCSEGSPADPTQVAVTTYTHQLCPNEGEAWDYLTNPNPSENGSTATNPQVTDYLRIYRNGNVFTPYSSLDGTNWVKGAAWDLTAASPSYPVRIGVFAFAAGGGQDIQAHFHYIHVYSEP